MPLLNLILEWKFDFQTIDWKVVIALAAIIVTIVLAFYFQWWRNRRRFSYEVLSDNLLISDESEIRDKLEIKFAGQPVKNVRLIVIRFINDGSQPIKKDDFQGRIKVLFPKAKILSAERVKSSPENLGVELTHDNEAVRLSPVLYNRRDFFQFKVLLSRYEEMRIDVRIVGVSNITKTKTLGINYILDLFFPLTAVLILVVISVPFRFLDGASLPFKLTLGGLFGFLSAFTLWVIITKLRDKS